jgi:hypothetical protein
VSKYIQGRQEQSLCQAIAIQRVLRFDFFVRVPMNPFS